MPFLTDNTGGERGKVSVGFRDWRERAGEELTFQREHPYAISCSYRLDNAVVAPYRR